jgi:hypothetical protein
MQWLGFECCNEQQQPGEGRGKTVKKDSLSLEYGQGRRSGEGGGGGGPVGGDGLVGRRLEGCGCP